MNEIGFGGVVTLDSKDQKSDMQLQFGVTVSLAPAHYAKTIVLTLVPRYMVVNKLDRPIVIRQRPRDKGKKPAEAPKVVLVQS